MCVCARVCVCLPGLLEAELEHQIFIGCVTAAVAAMGGRRHEKWMKFLRKRPVAIRRWEGHQCMCMCVCWCQTSCEGSSQLEFRGLEDDVAKWAGAAHLGSLLYIPVCVSSSALVDSATAGRAEVQELRFILKTEIRGRSSCLSYILKMKRVCNCALLVAISVIMCVVQQLIKAAVWNI